MLHVATAIPISAFKSVARIAFSPCISNQTVEEMNQTAAKLNQSLPESMNQTAAELNQMATELNVSLPTSLNQTTAELNQSHLGSLNQTTAELNQAAGETSDQSQTKPLQASAAVEEAQCYTHIKLSYIYLFLYSERIFNLVTTVSIEGACKLRTSIGNFHFKYAIFFKLCNYIR
jgi:hypothetical protein